jgi:hypothetical protein
MAKNQAKSENLLNSMARIDFLVQEGYTKRQLASMAGIEYGTFQKISIGFSKDIRKDNHERIKKLHSDYIINRTNDLLDDEPVIDSVDAEEGAKTIAVWLGITVVVGLLALVGLGFVVRYIIGLF